MDKLMQVAEEKWCHRTEFLHFDPDAHCNEPHYTIPTYENCLFALALMRTKQAEKVLRGIELCKRILAYQNTSTGDLPIYLHHFPKTYDSFLGVKLIPILALMLDEYEAVLDNEAKLLLSTAMHTMAKSLQQRLAPTLPLALRIKAKAALAMVYKDETLLEPIFAPEMLQSPALIGEVYVYLTLAVGCLSGTQWQFFWDWICQHWDFSRECYIGPAQQIYQRGLQPDSHLLDLIMAYATKGTDDNSTIALYGALFPKKMDLPVETLPSQKYHIQTQHQPPSDPTKAKGFHSLYLQWGGKKHLHTFVCQSSECVHSEYSSDKITLEFLLDTPFEEDRRDRLREVQFFFDYQPLLSTGRATTFELGDRVELRLKDICLHVRFTLLEGNGVFMGHLSRGNRPAQLLCRSEKATESYDWTLFLRTITRDEHCRIGVEITIES